jgi:unsaturated rhamnogalacturonyl hydrolase
MIWEIILITVLLTCLVIYGVDFAFYLKNRYCRFHIGRWECDRWQFAVEKISRKWLKHTPTVKISDNSRYMLLDFLQGKYRSKSIQSWQKAALILGLLESDNAQSRSAAKTAALDLLDKSGNWKNPPVAVDCGMLSYAILKAADDPQAVKPAMDFARSLIEGNINEDGMISYTGGKNNPEMYVDTLGLTCPFLALYAKVYETPSCAEIAFRQLRMYHNHGLLEGTALPNHAFHIKTGLPLGVYGWGRGTAWYAIGLMDTFCELESEDHREKVRQWISEAAESYSAFQHKDGGFGAILQRNNTYDSSATAALAWFYGKCSILFENDYYAEVSDGCLAKLLKKTRITGSIDECQGDTKGIGVFAQTYDIMPFAQGMALRAINLSRNRK